MVQNVRSLLRCSSRSIYYDVDRYKRRDANTTSTDNMFAGTMRRPTNPLQFSKDILNSEGDYLVGEIPNALKLARAFDMTTLDNGIRICTERWPEGPAAVGVIIGAGSRHETLPTSGTAHFMEHLHFKVGRRLDA